MIFHSGGGYNYEDIWHMPVRTREHLFNLLRVELEKKNTSETNELDKIKSRIKKKQ